MVNLKIVPECAFSKDNTFAPPQSAKDFSPVSMAPITNNLSMGIGGCRLTHLSGGFSFPSRRPPKVGQNLLFWHQTHTDYIIERERRVPRPSPKAALIKAQANTFLKWVSPLIWGKHAVFSRTFRPFLQGFPNLLPWFSLIFRKVKFPNFQISKFPNC